MCKTIKQRVKFNASPATVYDLLVDSKRHSAVTGRKATISRKIGGTFSVSGNDVSGINVDLVPGQRIVQAWRSLYSARFELEKARERARFCGKRLFCK